MGIDTGCALILGYTFDELDTWADENEEDIGEVIEDMDDASPYYDSDRDARVYGVRIAGGNYQAFEVSDEALATIPAERAKLAKRFGIEPKLYVSANVW